MKTFAKLSLILAISALMSCAQVEQMGNQNGSPAAPANKCSPIDDGNRGSNEEEPVEATLPHNATCARYLAALESAYNETAKVSIDAKLAEASNTSYEINYKGQGETKVKGIKLTYDYIVPSVKTGTIAFDGISKDETDLCQAHLTWELPTSTEGFTLTTNFNKKKPAPVEASFVGVFSATLAVDFSKDIQNPATFELSTDMSLKEVNVSKCKVSFFSCIDPVKDALISQQGAVAQEIQDRIDPLLGDLSATCEETDGEITCNFAL